MSTDPPAWTVVVLAGGRGRRLGEVDKASLLLNGRSLLDHVLLALPTEVAVVVVGPEMPTVRPVTFVQERPRFGGPVAGLAAAVPLVHTPLLALLATDMPRAGALASGLVERFREDDEVLMPLDAQGVRQPLCAVLRREATLAALAKFAVHDGVALRALMQQLRVRELLLAPGDAERLRDIDTPEDLRQATEQS